MNEACNDELGNHRALLGRFTDPLCHSAAGGGALLAPILRGLRIGRMYFPGAFQESGDDNDGGVLRSDDAIGVLGIVVGAGMASSYNVSSPTALVVEGLLDSMSAGILIYTAVVDLITTNFKIQTASVVPRALRRCHGHVGPRNLGLTRVEKSGISTCTRVHSALVVFRYSDSTL
ncbi:hypothetical protein ZIOFF_007913 [Zingiber officinale]|uniref:Uncharacterized protein n=1 Tax=Zingiber officinale TaxID=94328 RepID=A0A8J5HXV8_ZINOF|nr:hypothetical protein ZIOFF_007913 [Zingiber officinale]